MTAFAKLKREDVLHGLLAEIVIDPVELRLVEDRRGAPG